MLHYASESQPYRQLEGCIWELRLHTRGQIIRLNVQNPSTSSHPHLIGLAAFSLFSVTVRLHSFVPVHVGGGCLFCIFFSG